MISSSQAVGRGPIALVGGNEFLPPARELDEFLLNLAGAKEVAVVPTAAALMNPERSIATARRHFKHLGAKVSQVMVLNQKDGEDPRYAEQVRGSRFIYLTGGNPRRTAKIFRGSPFWQTLLHANSEGAVLAGSSAGAMILCERMLVPRWKKAEEGLGLLRGSLVLPHHDAWIRRVHKVTRSQSVKKLDVIGIDECTGLVIESKDRAHILGPGSVTIYRQGSVIWDQPAPWEGNSPL